MVNSKSGEEVSSPRITLLGSHEDQLSECLNDATDAHERAAIVLFRRFHTKKAELEGSDRYISVSVVPINESSIVRSSPYCISIDTSCLREPFRQCGDDGLVFGFAHSHPTGSLNFSPTDDANEQELLKALSNRNGGNGSLSFIALLKVDGKWIARTRSTTAPHIAHNAKHVCVLSDRIQLHAQYMQEVDPIFSRQGAAFGAPFVKRLHGLRVGIVGCGGTGSSTAVALARSGVGELVLVDSDRIEPSNLNRVAGAKDADVGTSKTTMLGRYISSLGLATQVSTFGSNVDESGDAVDALSTCDVLFGCTDDNIGRELLNAMVFSYSQVLIDVGLGGKVGEDDNSIPTLRYHHCRISTVLPEYGDCLQCQRVFNVEAIRYEYEKRDNPNLSAEEAEEKYLQGSEEGAPGVGPFTNIAGNYGVTILYDLVRPFRKHAPGLRRDLIHIDFITMRTSSPGREENGACEYCQTHEYSLIYPKYRLGRPALGKANVHY